MQLIDSPGNSDLLLLSLFPVAYRGRPIRGTTVVKEPDDQRGGGVPTEIIAKERHEESRLCGHEFGSVAVNVKGNHGE
jgi:hypothetical protein